MNEKVAQIHAAKTSLLRTHKLLPYLLIMPYLLFSYPMKALSCKQWISEYHMKLVKLSVWLVLAEVPTEMCVDFGKDLA